MAEPINFGIKYEKHIMQRFTSGSLLQGRLENNFDFMGARSLRLHTINTVPLVDYDRGASSNRYGETVEVGDTLQELIMSQDKSYSAAMDKGNNMDQAINKAGQFVRVETDEVIIPNKDAYGFKRLSQGAGCIVGATADIDENNVLKRASAARTYFNNKRVPQKGRTWFVKALMFDALIACKMFQSLESLGGKAVANGQIGVLFGSPVVEVPDDLLPVGVNFMLVHKSAGTSPAKIEDINMHPNPPGISGHLVEARYYWDTFVLGAKSDGIYVDVTTGSSTGASIVAAPAVSAAGAITVATGMTVKFTIDGSDPRFSFSAQTITAGGSAGAASGETVKAYQFKAGDDTAYPSPVTTQKVA